MPGLEDFHKSLKNTSGSDNLLGIIKDFVVFFSDSSQESVQLTALHNVWSCDQLGKQDCSAISDFASIIRIGPTDVNNSLDQDLIRLLGVNRSQVEWDEHYD